MNSGSLLLFSSFALTILATAAFILRRIRLGTWLFRVAAILLTVSVVLLAYAFVSLDFSIFYVWRHSSSELSIFYRLAAILSGQEGTYLVWAWLSLVAALVHLEKSNLSYTTSRLTQAYASAIVGFLLLLTLLMNPFESIFANGNAVLPAAGNSISPALVDILMPVHIFTAFVAYALMLMPVAASLSYLTVGSGRIDVKNYLRLSWLFLSISMIIGGLWANRLLGWIGFWQWDPLQSVTLASWLLVTASLHAAVRFKMGEYGRVYPLLCVSSFLGFIFTTFVARSGMYSSVHSFPGTPTWWLLAGFMVMVFVVSLLLSLRVKGAYFDSSSFRAVFSPHNTFYFTILLLIMMAFAALWVPSIYVILKYQGYEATVNPELYNTLFYPLVILLSYLTGICILFGRVQNRTLAYVSAGYFVASLVLGFAVPYSAHAIMGARDPGLIFAGLIGSMSVLSYLPAFFFVTGSILFKMIRDLRIKSRIALLHMSGINLIHLGFVFVVIGAAISSSFSSTHSFSYSFNEEGVHRENGGVGLTLHDFKVLKEGSDWVQLVSVSLDGMDGSVTAAFMKSRQFGFISKPVVYHGLISDVQVGFQGVLPHQIQSGRIDIVVREQPLISVLWFGCSMFVVGVLLTLASDKMRRKRRGS